MAGADSAKIEGRVVHSASQAGKAAEVPATFVVEKNASLAMVARKK